MVGQTAGSEPTSGTEAVSFSTSSTTFNESGTSGLDFRVESDSSTHMLFVDAGDNYVGIGTSTRTASAVTTIRTPGTSGAFIPLCLEVGIASNGFGALAFANPNGTQGTITCDVSGVTQHHLRPPLEGQHPAYCRGHRQTDGDEPCVSYMDC